VALRRSQFKCIAGESLDFEHTILYFECIQFTLANAIFARGSSAGFAFGPVFIEENEGSVNPEIGQVVQVAGDRPIPLKIRLDKDRVYPHISEYLSITTAPIH
jgi:hypothetical protein